MKNRWLVLCLLLTAPGCGSTTGLDVDLAQFDQIPGLGDLNYDMVKPAQEYDYWEYRFYFQGAVDEVIGSSGSKRKDELDPNIVAVFDTTRPDLAVGLECPPGNCYYYFASITGETVQTWRGPAEFRSFLGAIDGEEDAILLARADNYRWGSGKETAAIRPVSDGYELVTLKTVSFCDPVQTNRYLLLISSSGILTERDSEVWAREEDVCI